MEIAVRHDKLIIVTGSHVRNCSALSCSVDSLRSAVRNAKLLITTGSQARQLVRLNALKASTQLPRHCRSKDGVEVMVRCDRLIIATFSQLSVCRQGHVHLSCYAV